MQLEYCKNLSRVSYWNLHKFDELFDLHNFLSETRTYRFVCGRVSHSSIFSLLFDARGLAGLMFTSDKDIQDRLYLLRIEHVIDMFRTIGKNYPTEVHRSTNTIDGTETLVVQ